MRYSVLSKGLTISQLQDEVKRCGGRNLRVATASRQIFCDLDDFGAIKLRAAGCSVSKIGGVKATIMPPIITPPEPLVGAPVYTPEELVWGIGLEELRSMVEPPLYGEGFNLAIIDTGIRETHNKIKGRIVYTKNYTTDPMRDGFNHGTGVCSIALAIAPLCNILNLKVLNDKGEGTEEEVALAIDDCISFHDTHPDIAPTIINLSLGGPDDGNPSNPLRVACRAAVDRGIWVAASAGNLGPGPYTITCPACEQYVFAVGSAKYEPFEVSIWSSRGPTLEGLAKPDVVMFGEDISMASSVSDVATVAKSGTSFATPITSAMGILYHEGAYRQAVTLRRLVELPAAEIYYITFEELIDDYLPLICVKPQDVPAGKDYDYGYGILYGPALAQTLRIVPLVDISTMITPILGIALLGMVMAPMIKGLK